MSSAFGRPDKLAIELLVIFEIAVKSGAIHELHSRSSFLHVKLEIPLIFNELRLLAFETQLAALRVVAHAPEAMAEPLDETAFVEIS